MRNRGIWRYSRLMLLAAVSFVMCGTGTVFAVNSSSSSYMVTETQIGGGASNKSCSNQLCSTTSIGNMSGSNNIGNSTAKFETPTGSDPRLEMIVEDTSSNLGVLTTSQSATKTTSVKIQNYLNGGGYVLQVVGEPPKFGSHYLYTPSTPTASVPGVEMFGINVVLNTSPGLGANPLQVPDGVATFGQAATNYNQNNKFMYNSEDVVAQGVAKSGRTDYTISIVVNISEVTPAGHYSGDYQIFAIPVY